MASLRLNNDVNFPYCGGTLIHPQVVLTAGHVRAGRLPASSNCGGAICAAAAVPRCSRMCWMRPPPLHSRLGRSHRSSSTLHALLLTPPPPSTPVPPAVQCLTDPYTGKNYSAPGYQPLLVRVGGYWRVEEPSSKAELFTVVRQVGGCSPAGAAGLTPPPADGRQAPWLQTERIERG